MENSSTIPSVLEKFPRAELIQTPAIIHRLPRLSSHLGYDIYILREDLTGFALGGNKTRKLDYLIGDAIANKADTLVTMKATSFSRNAAAAASACGFELHVVLPGTDSEQNPASQAIFSQCDTKLHYAPEGESALAEVCSHLLESLETQGKAVYELHPGGSDSIGALAYVRVFHEIVEFSNRSGIYFSHIIHSTSSAGTQAGLLLGQCIDPYDTRIVGVNASLGADEQFERIFDLARSTAKMLGIQLDENKISVDDRFIGPGYARPFEEGKLAVKLFAMLEGVLLDQVYTGKAAAALCQYATNGKSEGDSMLFIHTGGNAGLYY
ncbi:MAG: pyridoxal-phosphate dependent enzyme [Deltaproteobacteria bacterium]|jgi:1-aminocyclopropane-1-carboxylate deaminase/D-cysteine desulfhydrase-like pyridoxal-dependent ACC family enzyme|nr:pyridoxal-phosphate dependent enzyme [Deltaproteobacteria bacterium]